MARNSSSSNDKGLHALATMDWWTVLLYVLLMVFGWLSICGASYSFAETDIFSLGTRSGMQIVWIATSIMLGLVIMMLDSKFFDTYAYVIYGILLLLLIGTVFNPHSIKGSHSWLVLGPLRVQPAEFGKFATSLALAKLMSVYGFDLNNHRDIFNAAIIILMPMLCIVGQHETGSALVYLAFSLMLYREGMTGSVLFAGLAAVIYFVIGVKYEDVMMLGTPTSLGTFLVLLLTLLFSNGMLWIYGKNKSVARFSLLTIVGITTLTIIVGRFIVPFDMKWVLITLCVLQGILLLYSAFSERLNRYFFIFLFLISSIALHYSANYILHNMMEDYQRNRIHVLLGLTEDLKGDGYNVHQSEIAIGSGGLKGKGFLNGTQTKLKFVPEQDTDFIFCTVGEEEGFLGSAGVLILFLILILRLICLAERQHNRFGRVYGYCVASIFLFHVFINVGMVLGLTPVIGIPLPFFSYGGSSLWGFTILLFIFLRLDAARDDSHR